MSIYEFGIMCLCEVMEVKEMKASTGLEKAQLASTYPASVMAVIAPLKSLILLDMEV